MELINRNPECRKYHDKLREIIPLNRHTDLTLSDIYSDLMAKYPRSNMVARQRLLIAKTSQMRAVLDQYLRKFIKKGAPSLFILVEPLYSNKDNVALIQELLDQYAASYREHRVLHKNEDDDDTP